MKLLKPILRLFVVLLILSINSSCAKHNTTPSPTYFSIYCVDDLSNPLPGVTVNLFNDSTDWAKVTNIVYTAKTNDSGRVTFVNVPSQVYYFQCIDTANCYQNFNGYFNANPVPKNTITNVGLTLSGYGSLTITNTSSAKNPYQVKLNGKVLTSSLAYGQSIIKRMPIGGCTVEAVQLKGFINAPADIVYGVNINQCQPTVQNIP